MYLCREYFKAKVGTSWIHGPLGYIIIIVNTIMNIVIMIIVIMILIIMTIPIDGGDISRCPQVRNSSCNGSGGDRSRSSSRSSVAIAEAWAVVPDPKGPSTHYLRTWGPSWVPKTINQDYLDP